MRARLLRAGLGVSLAAVASAPLTAPADAWACYEPVMSVACFVVGTSCRAFDTATGRGEICQLG